MKFHFYKLGLFSALLATPLCISSVKVVAQSGKGLGIIINSGSTNTCPYQINVQSSGQATYTVCKRTGAGRINPTLATQFFNDIAVGQPLSQLPFTACFKSASFGTKTQIQNFGQTSPDVSCSTSDSRVTNLYNDAIAIQQALNFSVSRN